MATITTTICRSRRQTILSLLIVESAQLIMFQLLVLFTLICSLSTAMDLHHPPIVSLLLPSSDNEIADQQSQCQLDNAWSGRWFLSEKTDPVTINDTSMSDYGRCVAMSSIDGYYLFHHRDRSSCWRCVAFFHVHPNVLQFKQTPCLRTRGDDDDTLMMTEMHISDMCRRGFAGDALMMTLFRVDAPFELCPLDVPANFTYSDMRGYCTSRTSTMSACANPTQLRLQYEACPEMFHSETQIDEMHCIGSWTSYGNRYFAAILNGRSSTVEADNHRCFIYEKNSAGGRVGISADATCYGLTELSSATTVITYKLDSRPSAQCTFPHWLRYEHASSDSHHRPKRWISIVDDHSHSIGVDVWIERLSNDDHRNVSTSLCIADENLGKMHRFVVYTVRGCDHGYQCIKVFKRDAHVIEIVRGRLTPNIHDACIIDDQSTIDDNSFSTSFIYDTLTLHNTRPQPCPNRGRYRIEGCDASADAFLGCQSKNHLVIATNCRPNETEIYSCHGHWIDKDMHYLIARQIDTNQKHCYVFNKFDASSISITSFTQRACHPAVLIGVSPISTLNATRLADCDDDTSSATAGALSNNSVAMRHRYSLLVLLVLLISRLIATVDHRR